MASITSSGAMTALAFASIDAGDLARRREKHGI
jgi:hypothetical protein